MFFHSVIVLIEEEVPCIIASSSTTQERAAVMSSNEKKSRVLWHRFLPLTGYYFTTKYFSNSNRYGKEEKLGMASQEEPFLLEEKIIEKNKEKLEEVRLSLLEIYNSDIQTHAGYLIGIIIGSLTLFSRMDTFFWQLRRLSIF